MFPGRALLKNIYFTAHSLLGTDRRQLRSVTESKLVPVLNFHRVSEIENDFWSPLHPQLFEQLLVYLQENFSLTSFSDLDKETKLPKAIISFDDGYLDFYQSALPILKKLGIRSNMNIIAGVVTGEIVPWHAELYDFLCFAPNKYVERIKLENFPHSLNRSSKSQRSQYGLKISRHLKNRSRAERLQLWKPIGELIEDWKKETTRDRQFMNLDEIRAIMKDHDIGAHSYSHESMAFESDDFFQADFQQCESFFQNQLQQNLSIYAFPNGSYREQQVTYLLAQKVDTVLLVGEALSNAKAKVHQRITISADSLVSLKLQALGYLAK